MNYRKYIYLLLAMLMSYQWTFAQKEGELPIKAGPDKCIVQTKSGKVRGYMHNKTYIYKGIPYGKADRFLPAEKPEPWKDIRNSLVYGPVCPIDFSNNILDRVEFPFQHDWGYSDEDCLRLNVWTQGINDNKKRPVMIWLHGGGYSAGSSQELPSYDGESISEKGDVVLVSINHRLNVLGFLDLSSYGEKYKRSANVGMLDIVMALEWIRDNISAFGGDPNNVTIFGQSGGGGKVFTLMNAPAAKGLFHKAIVQSGVVSQFKEKDVNQRISAALMGNLGLESSQVDSLQSLPYPELLAASKKALSQVQEELRNEGKEVPIFGLGWSPSVDGEFLPWQPTDAKAKALSANIPMLIGSTKNEFLMSSYIPQLQSGSKEVIEAFLQTRYKDKTDDYLAAIETAYPGDKDPTDLVDIDVIFRPGVISAANRKVQSGTAPVYMYLFSWQSPVFEGAFKSMHCMELPFVFNNIHRCEEMTGGGKSAYILADKVSQAWINFARSGDPNHDKIPQWPKYSEDKGALMEFDEVCEIKYHHDKKLMEIAGVGF